jgi:anti-sigma factor RsiW
MADEDAEIVALIDNELDNDARARLLARLAADEALRQRYEALREARAPIAVAFDALIEKAPLSRLRAALPPEGASRSASRPFAGFAFRDLAAGVVGFLLGAGALATAWIAFGAAPRGEPQDWRAAVEEYTNLYTNESFSPLHPDAALSALELSAVGARVGARLTPESVALPGLRFTVSFMLAFNGSPLAVNAFVDDQGAPVLLCVIDNKAPDAPMRTERRGGLSLAYWYRGGRGYLVIGRIPEERAAELAGILKERI